MQIILSPRCESFTGYLNKKHGYFIQRRKNRFFGQRSKSRNIPSDGHMNFILDCAAIAHNGLYFSDIRIHWQELYDALYEAYHFTAADHVGWMGREGNKITYDARDIINLKTTFGL